MPFIVGPTASGKSSLAVGLALELSRRGLGSAEIISADAFQVYRGMDIGTAKPSAADRAGVPHHLIDIVDPADRFTVADWLDRANAAVELVRSRGATPILVGGTHLYAKAFIDGLFDGPPADPELRARLERVAAPDLHAELARVDPVAAARIHPNDRRRAVRALEVLAATGRPIGEHQTQWDRGGGRDVRLIALSWPVAELNRRINARVAAMMAAGLAGEARALWAAGRLGPTAGSALGYRQLAAAFEAGRDPADAVETIKIETRRFAKNQRTWLKRLAAAPGSITIDAAATSPDRWPALAVAALVTDDAGPTTP